MFGKSGIQYTSALALVATLGLSSAEAGLKQLEIKGNISAAGHAIDFGSQTDSGVYMDGDLDFKMKFSQDVSARLDLEFDNAVAGDDLLTGSNGTAGWNINQNANRFNIGVDQAYFKLNDFLFRNFSLSVGKQNMNVSLRANKSHSWAFGDPVAVIGAYSTRDMDIKGYYLKLAEDSLSASKSNDNDESVMGVYGEYWLNDDSLVAGYLNYKSNRSVTATYDNLVHYGIGLDYFIGESLEVYGEIAGQSISSSVPAGDGSAFQLTLGGEYAFSDYDMKPTIGLEYYLQSGSDASDPAWQSVAGGESAADTDSLYTEASGARASDLRHGLGPVKKGQGPTGYSVIRLNGALSPSKSTKVGLGVHFFTNENNVTNDDLGTEIDLYGSWKYSQDVTFKAGLYLVSDASNAAGAAATNDITGVVVSSALTF